MNYEEEYMDFGIGDSMDGCGDGPPVERVKEPAIGILHAIYPRHRVLCCAQCGKRIRETEMMYTRDDHKFFCDIICDKKDRNGGV